MKIDSAMWVQPSWSNALTREVTRATLISLWREVSRVLLLCLLAGVGVFLIIGVLGYREAWVRMYVAVGLASCAAIILLLAIARGAYDLLLRRKVVRVGVRGVFLGNLQVSDSISPEAVRLRKDDDGRLWLVVVRSNNIEIGIPDDGVDSIREVLKRGDDMCQE